MAKVIASDNGVQIVGNQSAMTSFCELDEVLDVKRELVLLPEKVRFANKWQGWYNCVIQDEPQIRSISYFDEKYHIALPYVVYLAMGPRGLRVFFKSEPLVSLEDMVAPAMLPNVDNIGGVCLGDFNYYWTADFFLLSKDMVNAFWRRDFNLAIDNAWSERLRMSQEYFSFENWESATRRNPKFPLSYKWENHRKAQPISEFIKTLHQDSLELTDYADIVVCLPDA